jgi:multiple sugar transport system substrate-binding protein
MLASEVAARDERGRGDMEPTGDISRRAFIQRGGAAALSASALASLLAACGDSDSGGGGDGGGMLKMTNDKIAWKDWFAETGKAAAAAGAIGWSPVEFSDTTSYQAAIKTTGNTPKVSDMFSWWSGWLMKELVDAGMLADVSSIWEENGSAYSAGLRDALTFDGKQYGVPLNVAYWVTFYNKHTFDKHKVDVPTTWDEFTGACEKLKAADVTPLGSTIDGRWPGFVYFQELMVRKDPALYTALVDGKANYTDPGVVDVMNLWGDMIDKGWFSDPSATTIGTGANNFPPSFKQGKIAMVTWGGWFEPMFEEAGIKGGDDYGAFITPNIDDAAGNNLIFETGPWCVGAHGKRADDALQATKWFASKEGQEKWIDVTGFTSARSDVPSANPVDKEIDETIKAGDYKLLNRYWEATPHDIVEVAVDQFGKFMLKSGDPAPILETIQKQADQSWASLG